MWQCSGNVEGHVEQITGNNWSICMQEVWAGRVNNHCSNLWVEAELVLWVLEFTPIYFVIRVKRIITSIVK
ncbi:hypothetical protein D3C79_1044300 [compost metagenome]